MRIWAFLALPALCLGAPNPVHQTVKAGEAYRFLATADGLMHASLYRDFSALPANLEISEVAAGGSVNAWSDEIRSYSPENTQTYPGGWSFRSGLVRSGKTYEARATRDGELELRFFDPVGDKSHQRAVATGMSWLIRTANAWLSNQPRHGAVEREGQVQHPEARACIACHITQFTTRAYLTAELNGYPAPDSGALERVMARLRDNPRPLYGHPGINWARVIYSARTVSSRLPVLLEMDALANGSSLTDDRDLILGAARFLLLSDECGAGSPRPEADGARPDVSGFEIGLQTWESFRLAGSLEPENREWNRQSACMARLLSEAKPVNVMDAAWRVVAWKRMGKPVQQAVTDLLAWQREDGRFPLDFNQTAPAADFISYHALYALAVAGYRGPEVDKLVQYAFRAQRPDGSWKGAPEYKGFDTPFRETQFAVMALSELYPQNGGPTQTTSRPARHPDEVWFPGRREKIQADLVGRLANTPDVEALAASLDENLGQLREWQRAIRAPDQQARVERALRADSQREAALLASALDTGDRNRRLRLMQALSMPRPRIGNDMEPPQILADEGHVLQRALMDCLDPRDTELTTAAIRAGAALSDVLSPEFTLALLKLPPAFFAAIQDTYGKGRPGRLALNRGGAPNAELQAVVRGIVESRDAEKLPVVLSLLATLEPGDGFTADPYLSGEVERLLRYRLDEPALRAAAVFNHVADGPLMRSQLMTALASSDPSLVRAAVDVILERYVVSPNLVELTTQFFRASQGVSRRLMLDSLDPAHLAFRLDQVSAYSPPPQPMPLDTNLFSVPHVRDFILISLHDSDPQVQAAALDLAAKYPNLRGAPGMTEALTALGQSPVARTRLLSAALAQKHEPALPADSLLDFEFFRERVQPILQTPGRDGRSCIMCHASNARFPLRTDARANYASVLRKVDLADPAGSLLLRKPLLPGVTSDGDVFRTSHNGGERWPGRVASDEYQVILEWIRGARAGGPQVATLH
jgi:hypothetical protein